MISQDKALALLSKIDLFAPFESEELATLASIGQPQSHPPGTIVIRQGDPSDSFHVVLSGTYDIYLWDDLLKIERPLGVGQGGEIFGEMGLLTDETRSAFVRARTTGETLRFKREDFFSLLNKHPTLGINLAKMLAHRLKTANSARGLKLERLANFAVKKEVVQLLPLQIILRHRVLPVDRQENTVTIALIDPTDLVARNAAAGYLGQHHIRWVCVSQPDFESFRDKQLFDMLHSASAAATETAPEVLFLVDDAGPFAEASSETAKTLNEILRAAIEARASDIHFEPGAQTVAVRARVDGRLVELAPNISHPQYKPLVSRLKVLADLDITETRLPQDSVLRIGFGKRQVDLRLSTVPTPRGESLACRLFDPIQRKLDLSSLLAWAPLADLAEDLFLLPSGLVLITGPTGCGKTTTLYAGLQARQKKYPHSKVVTAEDPIEFELPGTTQVQVQPQIGLTFETILRSLLRQDPNVMLVGEIRDKASLEIAMEASLTGHLVLSSLHTNGAFETIMRLRQRGVEPYVIAASLRGIISQRLVPQLCPACLHATELAPDLRRALRSMNILPEAGQFPVWHSPGCAHCGMTGRKGRIGLFELLLMSPGLRSAIESEAPSAELESAAAPGTFLPMRSYARFLLEKGLIDPSDLLTAFPLSRGISGSVDIDLPSPIRKADAHPDSALGVIPAERLSF